MTKDGFLKDLLAEGYICEKGGQYPTVVCDATEVRSTAKKVKAIAKDKGYSSSFAIRSFREGMELISKDGEVSKIVEAVENVAEVENQPVAISEPIPMTTLTQDATA